MDIPIYIKNSSKKIEGDAKVWIDKFLHKLSDNADILEIGSGTGRDANYIENKGYNIIRTDIHKEFIEFQNNKYRKKVLVFDITKDFILDNFTEKFEGLFIRAVLNHFPIDEIEEILKRLKKVLKSHGIIALSLPLNSFLQEIIDFLEKDDFKLISKNISKKDNWVYIIVSYENNKSEIK